MIGNCKLEIGYSSEDEAQAALLLDLIADWRLHLHWWMMGNMLEQLDFNANCKVQIAKRKVGMKLTYSENGFDDC